MEIINVDDEGKDDEVVVESVNGAECSKKKIRRGGKSKKSSNQTKDDLNASVQIIKESLISA